MMQKTNIAKWGFGMAPISSRMRPRYDMAVQFTLDLMCGNPTDTEITLNAISELKGMFNRYLRKDQWDYAMVGEELGNPHYQHARAIASDLVILRTSLKESDENAASAAKRRLEHNDIYKYLENYQNDAANQSNDGTAGWIYILSTKEQPNILKIGRTERSVSLRVKEINSATGVLIPYGARHVFRVSNAPYAERLIHSALDRHRIRNDREFFQLNIQEAERVIKECLEIYRLRYRSEGAIKWFDTNKYYGFISAQYNDVFVHGSEVQNDELQVLVPGTKVGFDLHRNQKGPYATHVTIRNDGEVTE